MNGATSHIEGDPPRPAPVLRGRRVVSLALNVPGPLACARLARLGADVLKIEPPGGDPLEAYSLDWYRQLHVGQQVVRNDLKSDEGRALLHGALGDADLLLTSMRPAALDRLSLGGQTLRTEFPRLSHLAIYGHAAPHGDRAGHDLTYQAAAGLVVPPAMPATLLADLFAAERVVGVALELFLARERGGAGWHVEVALSRAAELLATPLTLGLTSPGGVLGGGDPFYQLYETASGWIAVAALEPHFRTRLLAELECDAPTALEQAFTRRTAAEWEQWALARDIPLVEVRAAP